MKLWLISQTHNSGYDTYDSAVVAAPDEATAKTVHPSYMAVGGWNGEAWMGAYNNERRPEIHGKPYEYERGDSSSTWAHPDYVSSKLIGEALFDTQTGVICASFNAG